LRTVPGLIAKDGAVGVFAAASTDGRALALKVADGSTRPWRTVLAHVLDCLGFDDAAAFGPVDSDLRFFSC
jgi:L-asparaginase II